MSNRFKLIVAALGLVVAAGTIGDASAATTSRPVVRHARATTTKVVTRATHRVRVVRIGHRAPIRVVVRRPVVRPLLAGPAIVRPVVAPAVAARPVLGTRVVHAGVVRSQTVVRTRIAHVVKRLHRVHLAGRHTGKTVIR